MLLTPAQRQFVARAARQMCRAMDAGELAAELNRLIVVEEDPRATDAQWEAAQYLLDEIVRLRPDARELAVSM